MRTREEKQQIIEQLADRISRSSALYLADFTGISVEEETKLRREFRKAKIDYSVAKNTLIKKALEKVTGYEQLYDFLVGPTAFIVTYDDLGMPAKIIKDAATKGGKLKMKAAVIEKVVYDGSKLDMLASMPTRKDVIAGILSSVQAPATGIVNVLNAVMRDVVVLVDEIGKKKAA